ncbi:MAG: hypothetical protein V4696_00810 [Pseudomonadota bacterium]
MTDVTEAMIETALQAQCDLTGCRWTDSVAEGVATIMRLKMEKALTAALAMTAARECVDQMEGLSDEVQSAITTVECDIMSARNEGVEFAFVRITDLEPILAALSTRSQSPDALNAVLGYCRNIRIDLETGCTKAAAIKRLGDMDAYISKALGDAQ